MGCLALLGLLFIVLLCTGSISCNTRAAERVGDNVPAASRPAEGDR